MESGKGAGAHDLLGIAPIARAVERITDSVVGGAAALLARVCLPAAEEFGLLLRDKVGEWRRRNAVATVQKGQRLLEEAAAEARHAPPRLLIESLNHASWTDSEEVQQMWAGLLASSCTQDGRDDSNWIFINLLGQLTEMQAHVLRFACETAKKELQSNGLIGAEGLYQKSTELVALTRCQDVHRIDRELDHLRALGLIQIGFVPGHAPEPLAEYPPDPSGTASLCPGAGLAAEPHRILRVGRRTKQCLTSGCSPPRLASLAASAEPDRSAA